MPRPVFLALCAALALSVVGGLLIALRSPSVPGAPPPVVTPR